MLRRTGKLCQTAVHTMQRQIWAALRGDRKARTARVDDLIEAKLTEGGRSGSLSPSQGMVPGSIGDHHLSMPSNYGATDC